MYIRVTTVYAENGTNITTRSWIRKFPSVFLIAFWERWEGRKELRGTIGMNPKAMDLDEIIGDPVRQLVSSFDPFLLSHIFTSIESKK